MTFDRAVFWSGIWNVGLGLILITPPITLQSYHVENAPSEVGDCKQHCGQGTDVFKTIGDEDNHRRKADQQDAGSNFGPDQEAEGSQRSFW